MCVTAEKQALRQRIRKEMAVLPDDYFRQSGLEMGRRILESAAYQNAGTVFCFVSCGKEPDTHPLMEKILRDGKTLCVPLCKTCGMMELKQIHSLSELDPGAYGILEPSVNADTIHPSQVDLALIPCLAATRDGKRLGKGGGYYDRFLAQYTGEAFLLCPARLLQEHIPTEAHDVLLPHLITEEN